MKTIKKQNRLFLLLIISIIFLIAFSIPACVGNSEKEKSEKDIRTLISLVENEVWSKGNTDLVDELYDANCILHLGSSMELKGTQDLKQMIQMFHAIIPDRSFKIDELIIVNDKVTERYTWQGTHKDTGKKLKISGVVIYHFKDGKVIEAWNFEDLLGLYQQLGFATESPFGQSRE